MQRPKKMLNVYSSLYNFLISSSFRTLSYWLKTPNYDHNRKPVLSEGNDASRHMFAHNNVTQELCLLLLKLTIISWGFLFCFSSLFLGLDFWMEQLSNMTYSRTWRFCNSAEKACSSCMKHQLTVS